MSASTKRKARQAEIEAGTYKKFAAQAKRDEKKAKERRTIMICSIVAAVLVVAAILLNAIPAAKERAELNELRSNTAVTIGDRSYSSVEIGYFYAGQYLNLASYYNDLRTSGASGLGSHRYTGTEVEGKSFESWRDYILDSVYQQLCQVQTLLRYARENGLTLDKDEIAAVDEYVEGFKTTAATYNYPSANEFLSRNYSRGLTLDMVRELELDNALANKAQTAYLENLEFTPEELKAEYDSFDGLYDSFSFATYTVNAEPDDEGKVTDEARAEAEAEAQAILAAYADGDDVEDCFDRFNGYIESELGSTASRSDNVSGAYLSSLYGDWLKDESRSIGHVECFSSGDSFTLVLFLGREDAFYPTANVRHILIQAEADEDGNWSDEALAAAKAEAERILAEWEAGEKTEESFAELARKYSTDPGSSENGGLYENIYKGRMVEAFNDFCFAGHKSGDVDIVYGTNGAYAGYHVMYYVGDGEIYGEMLARNSLSSRTLTEWLESTDITPIPGEAEALVDPVTDPLPPLPEETEGESEETEGEAPEAQTEAETEGAEAETESADGEGENG